MELVSSLKILDSRLVLNECVCVSVCVCVLTSSTIGGEGL